MVESTVSDRLIGLRTGRPCESLGPIALGASMTISSDLSGTRILALHFGQGPSLPANLSLTLNRVWHLEQVTRIAILNYLSYGRRCLSKSEVARNNERTAG